MKKLLFGRLLLVGAIISVYAGFATKPAFAIALPDSPPTLENIHANRNLIETGDMVLYGLYNIPYAATPSAPANQTFLWSVISTDNVTQLGGAVVYAYRTYGYGKGVIAFYWPAATAPTWGLGYTIRLTGSPAHFVSPPTYNFPIGVGIYTSYITQADNRAELKIKVITLAQLLDTAWGLSGATSLLYQTGTGTVLSTTYGEGYFRFAISGLQSMCPDLFFAVLNTVSWSSSSTNRTYTPTLPAIYESRFNGTWVNTAITSIGNTFHAGYTTGGSIVIMLGVGILVVVGALVGGSAMSGLMGSVAMIIGGVALGWFPFAALGIISLFCFMYLVALLIGKLVG